MIIKIIKIHVILFAIAAVLIIGPYVFAEVNDAEKAGYNPEYSGQDIFAEEASGPDVNTEYEAAVGHGVSAANGKAVYDPEHIKNAADFYGMPEGLLLALPQEERQALLDLTDQERERKKRNQQDDDNLSETYYIELLGGEYGHLYAKQRSVKDYEAWKSGIDESSGKYAPAWLKVTMAIADIDDAYEQLSFACSWLDKPEFYDFDESLCFSWKNGFLLSKDPCGVYGAYGYEENEEWLVEEITFADDELALDEAKTLSYKNEHGKDRSARGSETVFAAVRVRKKYIAELEKLTSEVAIQPKGTFSNFLMSVRKSYRPWSTFWQNVAKIFGASRDDEKAVWTRTMKRSYTSYRSEPYQEARREKFIYNTYNIILDREPVLEELVETADKLRTATYYSTDPRRHEGEEKYGSITTQEFISRLFASEEFKNRNLSTDQLIATICAATGQTNYGPYTREGLEDKLEHVMTLQQVLDVFFKTEDFWDYINRWYAVTYTDGRR